MLELFCQIPVEGWAPLMITMLMLGGVQLVMLGVIGECLGRNSHESRRRSSFVIESRVEPERPHAVPRGPDRAGA